MNARGLIVVLLMIGMVAGAAEYRDFMSADGKAIRGRVLRYDVRSRKVTIERDNRKTATVPLAIFSKDDQKYVLQWEFNKVFLSESSFKIKAQRKEVKDKDESFSGSIDAKKVEMSGYEIVLSNNSASKLDKLEIEYCIFYEQERASRGKQLCEQGVKYGTLDVGAMQAKSEKELMTESVRIYKAELDADWVYSSGMKNVQRGDVHGIWVRIGMELDSGEKIYRDYCLPDSLSNSKVWVDSSTNVGMNSGSKKKK